MSASSARVRGTPTRARSAVTRERVLMLLGGLFPGFLSIAVLLAIIWALWSKW